MRLLPFLIVIVSVLIQMCGHAPAPPAGPIEQIVEQTRDIQSDIRDLSQNYVIRNIRKYNQMVRDIRSEVAAKKWGLFERDAQEKFAILLAGIKDIRDFYWRILQRNQNGRVESSLLGYVQQVRDFAARIERNLQKERQTRAELEKRLRFLKTCDTGPRETIQRQALQKRLGWCRERIKMTQSFLLEYQNLPGVLEKSAEAIQEFLYVVELSAGVYKDAYQTLKLAKDIRMAYRTVEELRSLEEISEDIMESWQELDQIVGILSREVNRLGKFPENGV